MFAAMACSLDDAEGEIAADQPGGGGGGSGGGGGGGGGGGDKDGEQRLYRSSPIKYLLEVRGVVGGACEFSCPCCCHYCVVCCCCCVDMLLLLLC